MPHWPKSFEQRFWEVAAEHDQTLHNTAATRDVIERYDTAKCSLAERNIAAKHHGTVLYAALPT